MIIDHTGLYLLHNNDVARSLGRIAFPLFSYIVAHNFIYYSKHKKEMLARLFFWAILSQPIYYMLHNENLNILFLFFISLLTVWTINGMYEMKLWKILKYFLTILLIVIGAGLSYYIDYGVGGFFAIISFYVAFKAKHFWVLPVLSGLVIYKEITQYLGFYILSFLIILYVMKHEKQLTKKRMGKLFFYYFYPAHLFVIWLIHSCMP